MDSETADISAYASGRNLVEYDAGNVGKYKAIKVLNDGITDFDGTFSAYISYDEKRKGYQKIKVDKQIKIQ